MRLESYAQEIEDIILYCALRDVDKGFYIDVGANDPTVLSVTKFFYLRGWNGINIEPLMDRCLLLEEQRRRDINLCVAVGKEEKYLEMYEAGFGSTFVKEALERSYSKDEVEQCNKTLKKMVTLSDIYEAYCTSIRDIHFCKIDVEGYEQDVLEGIKDWKKFRPWIFCIEATEPGTDIPSFEKWEKILTSNGYIFALDFGINRYYVDVRKLHLMTRLVEINDFLQNNEIFVLSPSKIEVIV